MAFLIKGGETIVILRVAEGRKEGETWNFGDACFVGVRDRFICIEIRPVKQPEMVIGVQLLLRECLLSGSTSHAPSPGHRRVFQRVP
jgi:hypothetical protein